VFGVGDGFVCAVSVMAGFRIATVGWMPPLGVKKA
jgi:hypothetical protein